MDKLVITIIPWFLQSIWSGDTEVAATACHSRLRSGIFTLSVTVLFSIDQWQRGFLKGVFRGRSIDRVLWLERG